MSKKYFVLLITIICFSTPALPQEHAPAPAAVKPLAERFPDDDKAVAAILFGANLRGNLDTCDCNHPRGGLARRVGFTQAYKKKYPGLAVLQVEAGFFWYNNESQSSVTSLQNDYVSRAYSRWPMDAINLGRYDLFYASRLLATEGLAERSARLPMIKNLISANGVFAPDIAAPQPYLIRDVTAPRLSGPSKKLRVGFLGLAEPIKPGAGMRDGMVKNIFEAARRYVPELRKKCDVLVILSHTERDAAMKLAAENPEADLVIAGNAEGLFKPREVGKTLVVFAAPGNMEEGEVRIYRTPAGKFSWKYQAYELDESVPSDPEALAFATEARQAVLNLRTR